jgi:hypothetical protein
MNPPFRLTTASTEIPVNTTAAPSHWPDVTWWLYTTSRKEHSEYLAGEGYRAGERTKHSKQGKEGKERNGKQAYTSVRDPKCRSVSKMNNCPSAPVTSNNKLPPPELPPPGCARTRANAATSSLWPFPEGSRTGIEGRGVGRGNAISVNEIKVQRRVSSVVQKLLSRTKILVLASS